jgi:hypothetical protein
VDYFSLLDCAMHTSTTQADVEAATQLLHEGILAWGFQPAALLQQPGALLSLAGAVTSIIKACKLQCAELEAESAGTQGAAAAGVSAGLQLAVLRRVLPVVWMLNCLADELADNESADDSSSSGRSSRPASSTSSGSGGTSDVQYTSESDTEQPQQQQQQTAAKVLLAVLLARSLAALADAADPAAGLHAVLQDAAGCGDGSSSSNADIPQAANSAAAVDELANAFVEWQDQIFNLVETVHETFQLLGLGTAVQPCSSNSSDSSGRVRWAYLLQLARSKKLATAFDEMASTALHYDEVVMSTIARKSNPAQANDQAACEVAHSRKQATAQMYSVVLHFCRVLAGAAPLPHLCNNLGCSSLAAGGTEAAAAVKVCSGCGAWYCSAGCAAAHWRQHKKACRRMAALGLNVNA